MTPKSKLKTAFMLALMPVAYVANWGLSDEKGAKRKLENAGYEDPIYLGHKKDYGCKFTEFYSDTFNVRNKKGDRVQVSVCSNLLTSKIRINS